MDDSEIFDEPISTEIEEISQIDLRELSIKYILSFFENRQYETGGRIPHGELLRDENIATVLKFLPSFMFIEGLDEIHEILDKNEPPDDYEHSPLINWEVKFISELLAETAQSGIPKAFACGVILMNLKYCYGMSKWKIWS